MDVFVVSPSLSFINCTFPHESTVGDLIKLFSTGKGVPCLDFYVKKNGQLSCGEEPLQTGAVYRLEPRLRGGKGGFGSMLRALGAQIEKTTNREACRDLSGRRLRDVNHEKEMAEWLKKQTDREAEKEQRRLEKIRRKLAEPKRGFLDAEFDQQCHDLSERLEDSVLKGMQASSSSLVQVEDKPRLKRPAVKPSITSASPSKKKCFWTGLEGIQDTDSTDDESDDSEAEGFVPYQSSSFSSSSSSAVGAGPSSISRPAAVPTSTAREQERESQHLQSLPSSSSSSSSSASSASCSPPPIQENEEEKEENGETAQEIEEEEDGGMRQEKNHEAAREELEEDGEIEQETNIKNDEAAQEKEEKDKEMTQKNEKENTPSISIGEEAEKDKNVESVKQQNVQPADADTVMDLLSVSEAEELEAVGLERLKAELMNRGMKCGGTLQERAARLFSVRGLRADQIDPALLAKPSRGKKK